MREKIVSVSWEEHSIVVPMTYVIGLDLLPTNYITLDKSSVLSGLSFLIFKLEGWSRLLQEIHPNFESMRNNEAEGSTRSTWYQFRWHTTMQPPLLHPETETWYLSRYFVIRGVIFFPTSLCFVALVFRFWVTSIWNSRRKTKDQD